MISLASAPRRSHQVPRPPRKKPRPLVKEEHFALDDFNDHDDLLGLPISRGVQKVWRRDRIQQPDPKSEPQKRIHNHVIDLSLTSDDDDDENDDGGEKSPTPPPTAKLVTIKQEQSDDDEEESDEEEDGAIVEEEEDEDDAWLLGGGGGGGGASSSKPHHQQAPPSPPSQQAQQVLMMPWWDADLAGKGLRAGTLPPMTLPKPQDKRALNRRRFGFTSAQVEEDPDLAILCSQLESILSFFSSDINPERKGGCKQPVTLVKMAQVVRHFMGWLVEWTKHTTTGSRHTTHNLRMELLLNPTYLGEWMQHIIHTRGCSLATVLGYICSLCQVFQALKAILYGPATACTAQTTCRNLSPFHHQLRDDTPLFEKLLSSLQHIKRQVSAKVSCNRAAKQTYNTRTLLQLMAQNDREQLAKIPSPLKYGLFMEYATKLAEAWLRVFCLISDDTWTMLKGVSPFDVLDEAHHHIQARALFLVCRHIMASWWRVVQGGVDLPPLRPSMVRKLKRPDHQQCTHPHCQVQGCKGNLVVLPPPGADGMLMGFTISHYKSQGNTSMRNQMGAAHLPLPANSLAEQLTMALLDKVLPHLDSLGCSRSSAAAPPPSHHHHQGGAAAAASTEEEEEEEEEAPHLLHHNTNPPAHHFMLLDCWAPNQLPPSGKDTWELAGSSPAPPLKRLTSCTYPIRWKEVVAGCHSLLPHVTDTLNPLLSLTVKECPFLPGAFTPSETRHSFATAIVEYRMSLASQLKGEEADVLSQINIISARANGHTPKTLEAFYDRYHAGSGG